MNPAIGLLEFSSVTAGIVAADAMVKRAPIGDLITGSVQPGKYLVLVAGDVASVEESVAAGVEASGESIVARIILNDVHPAVVAAMRGTRTHGPIEALGIIETSTVAPLLTAADSGLKGAQVGLLEVNLADGLGGKAYLLFGGAVSDVEAAVAIGSASIDAQDLVATAVIPQVHDELGDNLRQHARFAERVGKEDGSATR